MGIRCIVFYLCLFPGAYAGSGELEEVDGLWIQKVFGNEIWPG